MNPAPENWTRRRLLRTLPGILNADLLSADLTSLVKPSKPAPFSRFVDVSASAALTAMTADIEIHWPTGASETHARVPADQLVTVREGEGMVKGRRFR